MAEILSPFPAMIRKIQENAGPLFESHPEYRFAERTYPLMLSLFSEQNKKTVIGTKGKAIARSWEFCLLDTAAYLGEAELDAYFRLCQEYCAQAVRRDDPSHSFTYVSLIILTEEFDLAQRKKLKKFHEEIDYRFTEGYGWSSLRIAVADLASRKVYTNSYGADLKKRLNGIF